MESGVTVVRRRWWLVVGLAAAIRLTAVVGATSTAVALAEAVSLQLPAPSSQPPASSLPALTGPVNDFARVVDATSAAQISRMIRALQAASGDVVVVATVPTIEPYGDIREMAVQLFSN